MDRSETMKHKKTRLASFRFVLAHVTCLMISVNVATASLVKAEQGFQSIHRAIEKAGTGDTVLIRAGIYREGIINIAKRITLRGVGYVLRPA